MTTAAEENSEAAEVVDLTALTIAQLQEYAQTYDIDLGGATKKADIVDVIASTPPSSISDPLGEQEGPLATPEFVEYAAPPLAMSAYEARKDFEGHTAFNPENVRHIS